MYVYKNSVEQHSRVRNVTSRASVCELKRVSTLRRHWAGLNNADSERSMTDIAQYHADDRKICKHLPTLRVRYITKHQPNCRPTATTALLSVD